MPGIVQRNERSGNAVPAAVVCSPPVSAVGYAPASSGIWSKQRDEISFDQLQKFWSELPPHARQKLLRIDKQMLFEQARKNLYCSRCNGLLLEGFTQIVLYGKSLQLESAGSLLLEEEILKNGIDGDTNDVQDPSVHPWGGLIATRDGTLTLMDCYLYAKSLWILQNVFDSARARERERELLYPDACGGGGRGWISHGVASYGRIHGTRETCALHTARLSCDTLVDFWSALGDETRSSLLRMKEEDFVERLMYRFDSKRFCRDCRRNVIREFKELKELKRLRRETHCTSWFCVADTAFHYEVSDDTIQADWHQSFTDTVGTYHHFEWAVGTAEGKSDILDFEDVGMNLEVQANGLALDGLDACFITLRAWRLDGRCTELTVKAHALKGQSCVHRRLVVGDGFVTITKGESIKGFFEHAEEAEEEEDDDVDKDGNELDSDGARPQKHAKSPELAREFLLDAATVIFKEQVEKAFREGTARQNAHSIFVCLALKLLEERVHVACKEIITLEKQIKLLEEEEKEKREEEERRERRRAKEREKKLRRKERMKEKERVKERKETEIDVLLVDSVASPDGSTVSSEPSVLNAGNSDCEEVEHILATTPDIVDGQSVDRSVTPRGANSYFQHHDDAQFNEQGADDSFMHEQLKSARRKLRFKQDSHLNQAYRWSDKHRSNDDVNIHYCDSEMKTNGYMTATSKNTDGVLRHSKANSTRTITRNCNTKFSDKFHCSKHRTHDGYENHFCSCNHHNDRRLKEGLSLPVVRPGRGAKTLNKPEGAMDTCRQLYHNNKYNHSCYDHSVVPKGKPVLGNGHLNRVAIPMKKVWEPLDSRKKCTRNGYDGPVSLRSAETGSTKNITCNAIDNRCEQSHETPQASDENCQKQLPIGPQESNQVCHEKSEKLTNAPEMKEENNYDCKLKDVELCSIRPASPVSHSCHLPTNSSSSDNSSSSLSEGGSSSSSFSAQSAESTSDSEDAIQQCELRDNSTCSPNGCHAFQVDVANDEKSTGACSSTSKAITEFPVTSCTGSEFSMEKLKRNAPISDASQIGYEPTAVQQSIVSMHNHGFHLPYYPTLAVGYHNQSHASWSAISSNGVLSYSQPQQYIYPNPLGYGLQASHPSDYCVQYNGLQKLEPPPLFNASHTPNYQPLNMITVANSNEQMKIFRTDRNPQADGTPDATGCANKSSSEGRISPKGPKPAFIAARNANGNSGKLHEETPSFSLFHSGGPRTVISRCNLDQASLKTETISKVRVENNLLDTETKVEEYSLFASKSARFSFF